MPLETTAALRVDLLDPGAPQIIHAVQDDSDSRKIAFNIYAGGAQWAVPDGTLVTVRYKKPDGTAGFYDTLPDGSTSAATIDGNAVTVALVPQAFTVCGNVPVQIKLYNSAGASIATFAIVMHVSANVVSDAEIVSSDYYNVLTKQIADVLAAAAPVLAILSSGAGAHNSVYRGKNLGSNVTAEQYAAIAAGTFDDLYIGDYWTIGGIVYRIAAFDYYLRTGDTPCTDHHATIVPDGGMYEAAMNDIDTTDGGYYGSKLRTSGLDTAKATISSAFGADHILTHRQLLSNAVSGGEISGWAWYNSQVELLSEKMVYGSYAWGGGVQEGYNTGIDKNQLSLFQARPDLITIRQDWWLRDVQSAAHFCGVTSDGYANFWNASTPVGVRPAFSIIG